MPNSTSFEAVPLDEEALAVDLDIARRILAGDEERAEVERDLNSALLSARATIERRRANALQSLSEKMRRLSPIEPDFSTSVEQARAAIQSIAMSAKLELGALHRRRAALERDRRTILSNHESVGSAEALEETRPPDSALLATGALLAAAAVESVGTAMLFADARGVGLIQAYVLATMLSGINVLIGYLGGYLGVRTLVKRGAANRALGLGGLFLAIFAGIVLNVTAMNWRWQLQYEAHQTEKVTAEVAPSLWDKIFAGESVILWMLGALTFALALTKGATRNSHVQQRFAELNIAAAAADESIDAALGKVRHAMEEAAQPSRAAIEERVRTHQLQMHALNQAFSEGDVPVRETERAALRLKDIALNLSSRFDLKLALLHNEPQAPALPSPGDQFEAARNRAANLQLSTKEALGAITREIEDQLAKLRRFET